MLKMIKYFKDFSVFSGSDSLALKAVKSGGAGAITAVSNISGKLLSYIINNWKEESSISIFSELLTMPVSFYFFLHYIITKLYHNYNEFV